MTARAYNSVLSDRPALWAFGLGCIAVTAGVVLHLPMFLMARSMHYRLAGMAMEPAMLFGMALIVTGIGAAAYGLLRRRIGSQCAASRDVIVAAPEDAPLGPGHWLLMLALTLALVIDTMKPASLGFAVSGMAGEYAVSKAQVSLVPFFALIGTVVGSLLWGVIADVYGRKASILLSAVLFVGTSICGAMPSLAWNIGMCFMMGAAAGGMLPVTYALLAEMMPTRHRGWSLVLVGGLGAAGGYFAASGLSALLQPIFGWRVLWLLNLPTGLLLVVLGGFIPESAKFLLMRGRVTEAAVVMRRFDATVRHTGAPLPSASALGASAPDGVRLAGTIAGLSVAALSWGFVNFGLLLWLPGDLVSKGYSIALSSRLLAQSALIACPTVVVAALLYSRWSTRWSLAAMIAVMLIGLAGVFRLETAGSGSPVLPVALLIVGSNGLIAILLPYAAESFALGVRARATGWVAACTKAGGVLAQTLGIAAVVPPLAVVAAYIAVPTTLALVLTAWFGAETRGSDLRRLDAAV